MERPSWIRYFLELAKLISTRATCPRASVGAILVRNNRVLATGYNGALSGEAHCLDIGCEVVDNHCLRAIHAEVNVIGQAAKFGIISQGATLYLYDSQYRHPCIKCWQVIRAAGISLVICKDKISYTADYL